MSGLGRFIYHSFPRRYRQDPSLQIDKGLEILESIVTSGFALTPEITEWSEPRSDGSVGHAWANIQKTCCFTELSPADLSDHSSHFGSFSIEFDLQAFRELGGIPVFYLPRATNENRGLESLAASFMARTGEIQRLLDRLAAIEIEVVEGGEADRFVGFEKDGQLVSTRCSYGGAQDLIKFLTHEGESSAVLRNALRALSAFFYPAEDFEHNGEFLSYYRQREWRLIANMKHLGQDIDRAVSLDDEKRLMNIDEGFFSKELQFHSGVCRRIDQSRMFTELGGRPIISYAKRIIAPRTAISAVSALLSAHWEIPIVALEDLSDR